MKGNDSGQRQKWQIEVAFNWRFCLATFTPLLIATCISSIACILFSEQRPRIDTFPDGRRSAIVQTFLDAFLVPIFFGTLLGSFGLLFFLFRKSLIAERIRNHPHEFERYKAASPIKKAIGNGCVGVFFGFLGLLITAALAASTILEPYRSIRTIELYEDTVALNSWFAKWSFARSDIADVKKTYTFDKRSGNVSYRITIAIRDGRVFRTGTLLSRPAPGSPKDQSLDAIFTELVEAIEQPPFE